MISRNHPLFKKTEKEVINNRDSLERRVANALDLLQMPNDLAVLLLLMTNTLEVMTKMENPHMAALAVYFYENPELSEKIMREVFSK